MGGLQEQELLDGMHDMTTIDGGMLFLRVQGDIFVRL